MVQGTDRRGRQGALFYLRHQREHAHPDRGGTRGLRRGLPLGIHHRTYAQAWPVAENRYHRLCPNPHTQLVKKCRPVRGREIPADGSKRRRQVRPRQSLASCQRLCRRLHGRNNRFPLQHRFRRTRGGGNLGCSLERKVPAENLREGCLSRCLFCFDSVCQVRRYLERTNYTRLRGLQPQ